MKVILCGYNWTGCSALDKLLQNGYDVYVYTHTSENCVADLEGLCVKRNIPYSKKKININNLPFNPDVICSVYYRYIIDKDVIEAVNGKIFNLHPALLPKYRGCSSLTWAMINGEDFCGYTYHYIDSGCDTGNIIIQEKIRIEEYDTQLTLYNRVMFEAMKDFEKALNMVLEGIQGIPQEGESSYYKRGCPQDGVICDMNDTEAERFIRAMIYPPYKRAKFHGVEVSTFMQYQGLKKTGTNNELCDSSNAYDEQN